MVLLKPAACTKPLPPLTRRTARCTATIRGIVIASNRMPSSTAAAMGMLATANDQFWGLVSLKTSCPVGGAEKLGSTHSPASHGTSIESGRLSTLISQRPVSASQSKMVLGPSCGSTGSISLGQPSSVVGQSHLMRRHSTRPLPSCTRQPHVRHITGRSGSASVVNCRKHVPPSAPGVPGCCDASAATLIMGPPPSGSSEMGGESAWLVRLHCSTMPGAMTPPAMLLPLQLYDLTCVFVEYVMLLSHCGSSRSGASTPQPRAFSQSAHVGPRRPASHVSQLPVARSKSLQRWRSVVAGCAGTFERVVAGAVGWLGAGLGAGAGALAPPLPSRRGGVLEAGASAARLLAGAAAAGAGALRRLLLLPPPPPPLLPLPLPP